MNARALAVAALLAFAWTQPAHAITEAEKALLNSAISRDAARTMGQAADAAGLARIIATGESSLVSDFGSGLSSPRIEKMPPEIEALVVKHFDDPRVGAALRALPPRYQTRALFDRYYAQVKVAYKADDPVFREILRTDLAGIEQELLAVASRFPTPLRELNPVLGFLASRGYPGAIDPLLAAIGPGFETNSPYNGALDRVLAYDSPEAWKRANAEVERLRAEGKVNDKAYERSRLLLDNLVSDPQGALARRTSSATTSAYSKRRQEIIKEAPDSAKLRDDPKRYVAEQERFLERLDAIAAEFGSEAVDYLVAGEHASLGLYARMRTRDVDTALRQLAKSAKGKSLLGQVVYADTLQLDRRDKAAALRAYEAALETASATGWMYTPYAQPGSAMNEFWKSWLTAEIAFLKTGTPFRGRVSEAAISGFWQVVGVWKRVVAPAYPDWPYQLRVQRETAAPNYGGMALGVTGVANWPDLASANAVASDTLVPGRLRALPASRMSMMMALMFMSAMRDPPAMLAEFARHDPSGYWTTIVLGTVAWHEQHGRDGALLDGVADAMPGMAAEGRPNSLAAAAKRYLQSRELRAVEKK